MAGTPPINLLFRPLSSVWISLSLQSKGNPDFLLTLPEFPRIALESPSASGGKFWLGVVMESGVSIRWGRAGTAGTVKHFPLAQCKNNNPLLELKDRFMSKIGKGYNLNPHDTRIP